MEYASPVPHTPWLRLPCGCCAQAHRPEPFARWRFLAALPKRVARRVELLPVGSIPNNPDRSPTRIVPGGIRVAGCQSSLNSGWAVRAGQVGAHQETLGNDAAGNMRPPGALGLQAPVLGEFREAMAHARTSRKPRPSFLTLRDFELHRDCLLLRSAKIGRASCRERV